jgi:hypothetical protein
VQEPVGQKTIEDLQDDVQNKRQDVAHAGIISCKNILSMTF